MGQRDYVLCCQQQQELRLGFVEANGGRVKDQYQSEARTDDVAKALLEQLSKQSNLLSSKKDRSQDPQQMHEIIGRRKP